MADDAACRSRSRLPISSKRSPPRLLTYADACAADRVRHPSVCGSRTRLGLRLDRHPFSDWCGVAGRVDRLALPDRGRGDARTRLVEARPAALYAAGASRFRPARVDAVLPELPFVLPRRRYASVGPALNRVLARVILQCL